MPIYYYTEKDDKSDVWKKVVAGNQVSWYKNGAMRLGGPDMSKVYLSDNAGKPLSSGYHNYDMARKEQAIQRQGATMQIRSMESQMNALLNKANRLKSGGLSKDSDNNEVREYENSLIKYNELQKKYIKAGGSTSKYKYKNPSAYGIAQGADFDNDGIINSKDKDIDNDGVRNEKDRDDYNKVIGANPKSTKTNNAGLNPSRQKSNTPLGTNQPKQDTAKTAKPLNKIAKDTDKDGIANKYDIWDRTDGVPKSVNQLDELKRARNRLENKISLAQKSKSSDLKDDIAALKSDLNTVNSRIAKLRGATDNSGQTTPRGSNPLKPDPAKPVNPSKPTVLPSTNDMADLLDDDQFRQSYVRGRFKKAFGAKGDDVYEKAIDAMVAANPNGIRIKGDRKSGSYSVEVKDSKGAWTSRNIAVANVLVKYADFGGYNAVDKQATLERFNTRGAATISQVQARFDKAFGSGSGSSVMYGAVDKLLAQRVNGQEVAKEFGKRGEAGYFVAVKDSKGRWTSAGKAVTEALSKHVTDQQYSSSTVSKSKEVLLSSHGSGAGHTILSDFKNAYGDQTIAQKAMYASIDAMKKAEPNKIREFGQRGTAGHYIEIMTKDGWSGGVNSVTDKLSRYAPSKDEAAKLPGLPGANNATTDGQLKDISTEAVGINVSEIANKAKLVINDDINKRPISEPKPIGGTLKPTELDLKPTTAANKQGVKPNVAKPLARNVSTNKPLSPTLTQPSVVSTMDKVPPLAGSVPGGGIAKFVDNNEQAREALKAQIIKHQNQSLGNNEVDYLSKTSVSGGLINGSDMAAVALVSPTQSTKGSISKAKADTISKKTAK